MKAIVECATEGSDACHSAQGECSTCGMRLGQFCSPRVTSDARIAPFGVNAKAKKAIQSICKRGIALSDFFTAMNVSHHGLHHKTFHGHMDTMVQACTIVATDFEAASVAPIKELYRDLRNPPDNFDVIYDGTWLMHGHSSHTAMGCVKEMYTKLVVDHIAL